MDAVVIVAGFMASLNVTVITLLSATLVAPFAGSVDTTSGQTPSTCTKSSFLQPPKNAASDKAAHVASNSIFVFMILIVFLMFIKLVKKYDAHNADS